MTNTTTTTITLQVNADASPLAVAEAARAALLGLPDEPISYSNDEYWDGVPELTIELAGLGEMKISTREPVTCFSCGEKFFTKEQMYTHSRKHIATLTIIPLAFTNDEEMTWTCPIAACSESFDTEQDYFDHYAARH